MGRKVTCDVEGCTAEAPLPSSMVAHPDLPEGWRSLSVSLTEKWQPPPEMAGMWQQFGQHLPPPGPQDVQVWRTFVLCDGHDLPVMKASSGGGSGGALPVRAYPAPLIRG